MKPIYSPATTLLHLEIPDFESNMIEKAFISQRGSSLAYPDREDIQKLIADLRALAVDTVPAEFRHGMAIEIDSYQAKVFSAGLSIPVIEYNEQHNHYREYRYSDTDNVVVSESNFMRKVVFTLDMGNNRNHQFQSVVFLSRETTTSRGIAEELFKPEALSYLEKIYDIFPVDAEYALMVKNNANVIVAKYGDFSATLVV